MCESSNVFDQLARSAVYREYARAFSVATGMPLALRPAGAGHPGHHAKRSNNPLCAMFASRSSTCAACLDAQRRTCDAAAHEPSSVTCFAGLREAGVPIRVGERLIGFLQTGEVIVGKPSQRQFARTARQVRKAGTKVDLRKAKHAYFHTRTLTPKQYESVLRLLTIFAQHLGLIANQLAIQASHHQPESMVKARQYIHDHQGDELKLGDVARAVNMSTFYFCKTFKKTTGFTFTEYLGRLRIETARGLLAKPNVRVSEAAFEAGFQSLTHFNRTFLRLLGESPTAYRAALPK